MRPFTHLAFVPSHSSKFAECASAAFSFGRLRAEATAIRQKLQMAEQSPAAR